MFWSGRALPGGSPHRDYWSGNGIVYLFDYYFRTYGPWLHEDTHLFTFFVPGIVAVSGCDMVAAYELVLPRWAAVSLTSTTVLLVLITTVHW